MASTLRTSVLGIGVILLASVATVSHGASAVAASTVAFSDGVLTVDGDADSNGLTVGRTAEGVITLNGAVVLDGQATTANVEIIGMEGGAGHDTLRIDEANGPMPPAKLAGGEGNDQLAGGSRDDIIDGGDGADKLNGNAGADKIDGGAGNDKVVGGPGNDTVDLGPDGDEFTWKTGEGDDVDVQGGSEKDTLLVTGTAGPDFLGGFTNINDDSQAFVTLRQLPAPAERMAFGGFEAMKINLGGDADVASVADYSTVGLVVARVNVDPATGSDGSRDEVNISGNFFRHYRLRVLGSPSTGVTVTNFGTTAVLVTGAEAMTVSGGVGPDFIDASRLAAGTLELREFGFNGDDVLVGSPGDDVLFGAEGDDRIECRGGADVFDGGIGNNTIVC